MRHSNIKPVKFIERMKLKRQSIAYVRYIERESLLNKKLYDLRKQHNEEEKGLWEERKIQHEKYMREFLHYKTIEESKNNLDMDRHNFNRIATKVSKLTHKYWDLDKNAIDDVYDQIPMYFTTPLAPNPYKEERSFRGFDSINLLIKKRH
jgi:hypothetical protein